MDVAKGARAMNDGTAALPTSNELADERTKLALTRTIVALDRTLMAWIRTATSLISFGFTIYKFFQALRENDGNPERLMTPREVGLVMIGLGVAGLLFATFEYRSQLREIHTVFHRYGPFRRSPTFPVAATIVGLGILGFVMVFLRQ
jgi:putative membrane protein